MWDVISKIFDWLPGRREHYRNQIDEVQREMDKLEDEGLVASRADKYERLARKLRSLREKAKNT